MSHPQPKHLLIVNGVQFKKDLAPHPEFIARLEKSISIIKEGHIDLVVVSGGSTRKNHISEAEFGANYIEKAISKHNSITILKEDKSHTTIENVKFTKILLDKSLSFNTRDIEQITLVTTTGRLPRLRYIYKKLWPEIQGRTNYIIAPYSQDRILPILEFLYLIYTKFDIEEKNLARLAKKVLRNKNIQ